MKDYVFLILILLLAVAPPVFTKINEFIKSNVNEGFDNYTLGGTNGIYPCSETNVLVQDTYPITGINSVSDQSAAKMWWRYPIFEVGSFEQIKNNIRYPNNPDDGKCPAAN